jgi:hypothetical protein
MGRFAVVLAHVALLASMTILLVFRLALGALALLARSFVRLVLGHVRRHSGKDRTLHSQFHPAVGALLAQLAGGGELYLLVGILLLDFVALYLLRELLSSFVRMRSAVALSLLVSSSNFPLMRSM